MQPRPGPGTRAFIARLESLRGAAALMVAAFHVGQSPVAGGFVLLGDPRAPHGSFSYVLARKVYEVLDGTAAVIFFLVLSGFVLTRSLARRPEAAGALARRYVVARLFRIYPAVIVTVLVFALARTATRDGMPVTPGAVLANMLLWRSSLNGVMWSLQLEVLAIPLIFAAYLLRSRWPGRGGQAVAVLTLLLVALSFTGRWGNLLRPGGPPIHLMYAFLCGALVADLGPRLAPRLTRRGTTLTPAAAIFVFLAACPVLGATSNWRCLVETAGAAVLVGLVAFGPPAAVLGLLDCRPMHFLGRVSYSFYLLHPLTLLLLWRIPQTLSWLLDSGLPSLVVYAGLLVASAAVTALLASLFYAYVEQPGIAAGRRLLRGRTAGAVAASAEPL